MMESLQREMSLSPKMKISQQALAEPACGKVEVVVSIWADNQMPRRVWRQIKGRFGGELIRSRAVKLSREQLRTNLDESVRLKRDETINYKASIVVSPTDKVDELFDHLVAGLCREIEFTPNLLIGRVFIKIC